MAENSDTELARKDEAFAARITNTGDQEADHDRADRVLIEALRSAGFDKTADAWERHSENWWWS